MDDNRDAATRRRATFGLKTGGWLLYLIVALLFVATIGTLAARHVRVLAEQHADAAAAEVEVLRQRLADTLDGVRRQVEAFAAESQTLAVMQGGDALERRALEQQIARLIPGVMRARLTVAGQELPPAGEYPELGFADLELIGRMESEGAPPPLEVHMFQSPYQHFDIVAPVREPAGDRSVAGSLLVSLDVDMLQAVLEHPQPLAVYAELQQALGDGSRLVVARTPGAPPQATVREFELEGTRWRLGCWPLPVDTARELPFLLGVSVVALSLLGLLIYGAVRRLTRTLERDPGSSGSGGG